MAKVQFNCRLESDIAKWIADEAARLTKAQGTKYSQADVVTRLVVRRITASRQRTESQKAEGK